MELVKDALPEVLLIRAHNPLTLLHKALSIGLHGRTDEQCLESARIVRVALVEFSDRLAQVLKDDAEVTNALSQLLRAQNKG